MKIILPIFLFFLISSCGTGKEIVPVDSVPKDKNAYQIVATFGQQTDAVSEDYTIKSAKIEKNTLFLVVTISGECIPHDFKMIGSAGQSNSIQQTRMVDLIHFSNGDICSRKIDVPLEINISDLASKKENGSKTILKLKGWKDNLDYTFYKPE